MTWRLSRLEHASTGGYAATRQHCRIQAGHRSPVHRRSEVWRRSGCARLRVPAGGPPRLVVSQLPGHAELTSKNRLAVNLQVPAWSALLCGHHAGSLGDTSAPVPVLAEQPQRVHVQTVWPE